MTTATPPQVNPEQRYPLLLLGIAPENLKDVRIADSSHAHKQMNPALFKIVCVFPYEHIAFFLWVKDPAHIRADEGYSVIERMLTLVAREGTLLCRGNDWVQHVTQLLEHGADMDKKYSDLDHEVRLLLEKISLADGVIEQRYKGTAFYPQFLEVFEFAVRNILQLPQ